MARPVFGAAAMVVFLLGACGGTPEPENASSSAGAGAGTTTEADGGVRLALLEPSDVSDGAALEGELRVDGRCLYLAQPGSAGGTLLAFLIPDARWDSTRDRLVARGKSFAPGQRVRLGGSSASNAAALRWRQAPDPSCNTRGIMVVGSVDALP